MLSLRSKFLLVAEGLPYLALIAGFGVLIAQVTSYGFIPNAVPMEGGSAADEKNAAAGFDILLVQCTSNL